MTGALLARYLTPRTARQKRVLVTARLQEVPVNGGLLFREERVALLRDEKGCYALSLVCTHLGCTVTVAADQLSCPCHGSRFDRRGRVLKGPADRPLPELRVVVRDDRVEVLA